jgi:hypothetical protein
VKVSKVLVSKWPHLLNHSQDHNYDQYMHVTLNVV